MTVQNTCLMSYWNILCYRRHFHYW